MKSAKEISDELKKEHEGFEIICLNCSSHDIVIENTLGFSECSGGWGNIYLKCYKCGKEKSIYSQD